ncbi:MAG: DUF362 domain-containing protein [Firmicutes bacterium]|nr:DUF362 domain-containing protein [Bacillota bacterium]
MKLARTGYYDQFLTGIQFPKMVGITIQYEDRKIDDVAATTREELVGSGYLDLVRGKTVALAVGSRGIYNLPVMVSATIEVLKDYGAQVFIVPAMGSHGGADAVGQVRLLEYLGISEQTMGVEIRSCMEPVIIGYTDENVPVYFDVHAAKADYTISIARVKPHTTFRGPYESGMVKMNVIGLGKQKGADYCHLKGMANMPRNLVTMGKVSLARSNLLLSLAVVENAFRQTYLIKAIPKEQILAEEPRLLELAKSLMPKIPFDDLDLVVVDEIGKNITGTGMDPNIIQRFSSEHMDASPFIKRLVVLDLTEETDGNAAGAGFADIATMKLFQKLEMEKTYPNSLTARTTIPSKLPIIMDNDETAMKAGIKTAPDVDYDNIRLLRIRNTSCMSRMEISEALIAEARALSQVEIVTEPFYYQFDQDGNLPKTGFLYAS